ncbi:MAG: molybdopterin molybdotransferase MoeA, partial [Actinobacteria bacterium]|nr:molybdopterin molybdotransferase MoeA [Actinomycetota bacterium]
MAPLLPLEEAQARILGRASPLPGETVRLEHAAGRVLAEPARALVDLPPFASSAMDGFAVRASDTPGTLTVVGAVAAGRPTSTVVAPGQAIGIATGGVVPGGADAVVPIEYVVHHDNTIRLADAVRAGANVRPEGGDVRCGDLVIERGVRLAPAHVGALAAIGAAEVVCGRRPRAAVLATGTELQVPGKPLAPGQIYESNAPMLAAQLAAAGALVERFSSVRDDEGVHRAAIGRALDFDLVVTSGGVSVGEHDLVRRVAQELGVEEVFWGVAMKPGKPVSFGVRGGTLVFGLPGNPVSSLVAHELFVRPAVLALQGASEPGPVFERAVLARSVKRDPARDQFLRARLLDRVEGRAAEPIAGQESHMIARAASASALVHVPRGEGEILA